MKSKFRSVTLWINVAGALGMAVAQAFGAIDTDNPAAWAMYLSSVANFAQRFKTTKAIV